MIIGVTSFQCRLGSWLGSWRRWWCRCWRRRTIVRHTGCITGFGCVDACVCTKMSFAFIIVVPDFCHYRGITSRGICSLLPGLASLPGWRGGWRCNPITKEEFSGLSSCLQKLAVCIFVFIFAVYKLLSDLKAGFALTTVAVFARTPHELLVGDELCLFTFCLGLRLACEAFLVQAEVSQVGSAMDRAPLRASMVCYELGDAG